MSAISTPGGMVPADATTTVDDASGTPAAPTSGGGDGAGGVTPPDRAGGGAGRLSVAASLTGVGVVRELRLEADAISYVEGALAQLGSRDVATARRLLRGAGELDGNRVLTLAEAEKVIEPLLAALPGGGAALRAALLDVDRQLEVERAREAEIRDGVSVAFNSDPDGPGLTNTVLAELDAAVAAADGQPLDIHIMIFSFTDARIADKLEQIARDNPNAHIRILTDWTQTTTANGYKPATLARLGLPNLEVRFKKDQPYRFDAGTGRLKWDHSVSRGLNHHKGLVTLIDGKPRSLLGGSFNWSPTADRGNYENVMTLEASAATNRVVMRHYEEEFEAFWNDGRASLTLDEAGVHRRRIDEAFRADPQANPREVVGLEAGAGADLKRLAPEDVLDFNDGLAGERIATLLGGGADGTALAATIHNERLRFGRFRDVDDLVARVPGVGQLGAGVIERITRETIFGNGLVPVNEAPIEALLAVGVPRAAAEAIVAHRDANGDFESMDAIAAAGGFSRAQTARFARVLTDDVHRVSFSARMPHEAVGDTGYAAVNEEKTVPVLGDDGIVRLESATLGAGAVDIMRRAEPGETLTLATYGLSTSTPEYAALVAAARRGVTLRVVLNRASNESVARGLRELAATEGLDIEVKTSGRTMHQKYLVHVEGQDAFNGSANLSGSSATRHSEDRFFFKNNPALARAFEADFDRLWDRLPT